MVVNYLIEPLQEKGNQEIIWNYIWRGWIHLLDPLEEKVSKKFYETTSGGGGGEYFY